MKYQELVLPDNIEESLKIIRDHSMTADVLVFKRSPICPVSWAAEREFREYLAARPVTRPLHVVEVDVIARKPLARGLVAALDIRHESPQALLFRQGQVAWHDSHEQLNTATFARMIDG